MQNISRAVGIEARTGVVLWNRLQVGATTAVVPMAVEPFPGGGLVTGDRAWITDEKQTRLFDLGRAGAGPPARR